MSRRFSSFVVAVAGEPAEGWRIGCLKTPYTSVDLLGRGEEGGVQLSR